jgi:hypothetical protein
MNKSKWILLLLSILFTSITLYLDFIVKTVHFRAFFYSMGGFAFGASVVKFIKNDK